ncbi:hypothetical protein D4740_08945 [Actinomyces sp. 2119]|uniref:TIGR03089 family protein n=1 Tax=Actinomyces sp. 2119 TaxID=2321393 RepID=UPI000E6CD67C|nr:TIGR03089 family protein [Actinomyces sp. 2119]RJF41505.1 hypothetical protein D4740_08945 [Actinomyces sp. 2119]
MYTQLLETLPAAHDSDRPWLVCYGLDQRIELTGRVLSMWHAKVAGLITNEVFSGDGIHIGTGVHWRGVIWACGAWLAGQHVLVGTADTVRAAGLSPGLSVALDDEQLCPDAEVQVLAPPQSLALRWPAQLPPLVLDGAADLMAYPDHYAPVSEASTSSVPLTELDRQGRHTYWSEDDLLGALYHPGSRPAGDRVGAQAPGPEATARPAEGQQAVLVHENGLAPALRGVLTTWRAGRTAVLLMEGAGEDVAQAAARQEGATW